jgi:hypothetical protein
MIGILTLGWPHLLPKHFISPLERVNALRGRKKKGTSHFVRSLASGEYFFGTGINAHFRLHIDANGLKKKHVFFSLSGFCFLTRSASRFGISVTFFFLRRLPFEHVREFTCRGGVVEELKSPVTSEHGQFTRFNGPAMR